MLTHLIEACSNIESLQLGYKEYGNEEMPASVDYLSAIRFHNLRSLSLIRFQLLDGSFLPSVLRISVIVISNPLTYVLIYTDSEAVSKVRAPSSNCRMRP